MSEAMGTSACGPTSVHTPLQTAAPRPPFRAADLIPEVRLALEAWSGKSAHRPWRQEQERPALQRIQASLLPGAWSRGEGGLRWPHLLGPEDPSSSEQRHS